MVEEADETIIWLELLMDSGLVEPVLLEPLLKESRELTAIFAASYHAAKSRSGRKGI